MSYPVGKALREEFGNRTPPMMLYQHLYDQTESDFRGTSKQITANSSYYNEKSASQYNEQTSGEKTTLLTISEWPSSVY